MNRLHVTGFSLLALVFIAGTWVSQAGESSPVRVADSEVSIDAPKLWAQTCQGCHNTWPVDSYSKAQWGIIVHHMQVRACLTGKEARAIADFLQNKQP